MSVPSPTYYDSKGISVSWIFHQLLHLLISRHWLLFLCLGAFALISLSLLIAYVLLVYLTVKSTAPPVIIFSWILFIGLHLPLVIAECWLLLSSHNLNSIAKHI